MNQLQGDGSTADKALRASPRRLFRWGIHFGGAALFVIALSQVDISVGLALLSDADWRWLLAAFIVLFVGNLLSMVRWRLILTGLGLGLSLRRALVIHFIGRAGGWATPGGLGEFVKALYLQNDGYPLGVGIASIFVDRFFDILIWLTAASLAALTLWPALRAQLVLILAFFALTILAVTLTWRTKRCRRAIVGLCLRLIPVRFHNPAKLSVDQISAGLVSSGYPILLNSLVLSALIFLSHSLRFYFLTLALGANVPIPFVMACVAVLLVLQLLPTPVLGIGTRELSLVFLFSLGGFSGEVAIGVSVLMLLMLVVLSAIGLFLYLANPLDLGRGPSIAQGT